MNDVKTCSCKTCGSAGSRVRTRNANECACGSACTCGPACGCGAVVRLRGEPVFM